MVDPDRRGTEAIDAARSWITAQGIAIRQWPGGAGERPDIVADQPILYLVEPGADPPPHDDRVDWLREPIDRAELLARADLLLARARAAGPVSITIDHHGVLLVDDELIILSEYQARLLRPLLADLGRLVPRHVIMANVWPDGSGRDALLTKHLTTLRNKLRSVPLEIHTIRTKGFVLERRPSQVDG